ncbi:hypothetical protein [Brevundimonas sp.]|uniref:hypothetical protein n=1 Tax=Brevundimonas sp. TaxID=1871086 RepID=UPI0025BB2D7D|nr:hypothetical protein [Brevundimonas sp.]
MGRLRADIFLIFPHLGWKKYRQQVATNLTVWALGRAGNGERYRQKGRHHKSETLRKASKGLVRIHILVSGLSAISEAISKAPERPELFPLDYTNYPKPLIGLGFFLAYRPPNRLNNRQTGSILKTFRKF